MLRIHKKKTIVLGVISLITVLAISAPIVAMIKRNMEASALETVTYTKGSAVDLVVGISMSENTSYDETRIDNIDLDSSCVVDTLTNVIIKSSCLESYRSGQLSLKIYGRRGEADSRVIVGEYNLIITGGAPQALISSHIDKEYSRGIVYRGTSVTVNSNTNTSRPFTINGFSTCPEGFDWGPYQGNCANNGTKNTGIYTKVTRGAIYNNEYLDVLEYTWVDNIASERNSFTHSNGGYYGRNGENGVSVSHVRSFNTTSQENFESNNALAYTHREFHFYKTGTNEEVSFKGVISFGDFEFLEGYRFIQGQRKFYFETLPTYLNGSLRTEEFIQPVEDDVTAHGEMMLWAAVESTPSVPLHVVYVTPAWRNRASNSETDANYVRYHLVGTVPSGASAPAYDTIVKGGTMTPTAAPSVTGYTFSGWYTNEAMTTPAGSDVYVDSDVNLYGKYTRNVYNITASATNGTTSGNISNIEHGTNRTVTYNCNTGYHLTSVTVDGAAVSISAHPNSYAFDNITSNHSIAVVCNINTYTITASAVNGTTSGNINNVEYGTNKTVTYNCNTGYHLASVTVDGAAVSITNFPSSYAFNNVTANHTIAVVCEINTYDITTNIEHGTITDPISKTPYGSTQKIEYSCEPKYHVASAIVDGITNVTETNPTDYTFSDIKDNHDISVVCEHDPLKVETSIENGDITPSDETVIYETDFKVDYNCNTGFSLESVTVNGEPVDKETFKDSYQFIKLQEDATVAVVCKEIPVGVETSIENGEITGSNYEIGYGEDFTVKYTCADGNAPLSIKVNDEEVSVKDFPSEYGFKELTNFQKIDVICAEPKETSVITPDTGALTNQYQEENGVMDYVLTGIMVLAGCTGTALLIKFCLHSRDMKSDRQN